MAGALRAIAEAPQAVLFHCTGPGAVVCPPQSAYMSSFLRLFAQRYGTPWRYLEMLGVDAGKLAEKLRPKEL